MSSNIVEKLRKSYPDRVPCLVNFEGHKMKFMVPGNTSGGAFLVCMRTQLKKRKHLPLHADKAIFVFHRNRLMCNTTPLSDLDTNKGEALEFDIQLENTFG